MKHLLFSLMFLLTATLYSCGSDEDDAPQTLHQSQTLRTGEIYTLPGAYGYSNSSNTFVASVSGIGLIEAKHVGTTTIEATGNNIKYICSIQVIPAKSLLNDLGGYIGKTKSEIEQTFGPSISNTGYNYFYTPSKLEKEIQIRYSKNYTMDYGSLTFDKKFYPEVTDLINEYYALYKINGNYTIYINANTFDEATILLARYQTTDGDRIIYMTPSMYTLIGDLTDLFPTN